MIESNRKEYESLHPLIVTNTSRCQQTYHQANLYKDTKITLCNDSLFPLIFPVPC